MGQRWYQTASPENQVDRNDGLKKTMFGIQNQFWSNHSNFKSTAVGQAVLRVSKLREFDHARC